jgi:hypothetical protein
MLRSILRRSTLLCCAVSGGFSTRIGGGAGAQYNGSRASQDPPFNLEQVLQRSANFPTSLQGFSIAARKAHDHLL